MSIARGQLTVTVSNPTSSTDNIVTGKYNKVQVYIDCQKGNGIATVNLIEKVSPDGESIIIPVWKFDCNVGRFYTSSFQAPPDNIQIRLDYIVEQPETAIFYVVTGAEPNS